MRFDPAALSARKAGAIATVVFVSALAGGCASEGIEIEGTLLDSVGLSTSALSATQREPKIQDRATLVMPPSSELPVPATPGSIESANLGQAFPQDPEQLAAQRKAAQAAQIKALCDDREWALRTKPEEFNRVTRNGQLCNGMLSEMIGGLIGSSTSEPLPQEVRTNRDPG